MICLPSLTGDFGSDKPIVLSLTCIDIFPQLLLDKYCSARLMAGQLENFSLVKMKCTVLHVGRTILTQEQSPEIT